MNKTNFCEVIFQKNCTSYSTWIFTLTKHNLKYIKRDSTSNVLSQVGIVETGTYGLGTDVRIIPSLKFSPPEVHFYTVTKTAGIEKYKLEV